MLDELHAVVVASVATLLVVLLLPSSALGQVKTLPLPQVLRPESASAAVWQQSLVDVRHFMALPAMLPPGVQRTRPPSSRDSLKNGAIIGAVVGALALGGLHAWLCCLYGGETNQSCEAGTLGFAAIGAGVGLGAGVIVDAALARDHGVRIGVGIRF